MTGVPDERACLDLLQAAGCPADVVRHARTVARLALALADRARGADRGVVAAGALLHDIGRAVTHGIDHLVQGVLILRAADVAEPVVQVVQRHVGAGITDDEARRFGWPVDQPGAYLPRTLEERIVCHADNLVFGHRYATRAEIVAKLEARGLGEAAGRVRALHEGLRKELGVDPDDVARSLSVGTGA